MSSLRQHYYDLFSKVYDVIIRLHSRDAGNSLRKFIAEKANLSQGDKALDLCTGTSFINHTIEGLLDLCKKAYVVLIGPTSPLSPILFDYGFDAICGSKVIDPDGLIRSISEGATFKEVTGVRLLTLSKT